MRTYKAVNFKDKFTRFADPWSPRVVAELNDYQFKLVRLEGTFTWHDHKATDEAFIILEGSMTIEFRDGAVHLGEGEMFVVPRGVEHRPRAKGLCKALIVEPRGVVNTGDAGGELTAPGNLRV